MTRKTDGTFSQLSSFDTARIFLNTPGMRSLQITKGRTPPTLLLDHGAHPTVALRTATHCQATDIKRTKYNHCAIYAASADEVI